MNFYQIPAYNYKLECHEDYRRNMGAFLKYFDEKKDEQSWHVMFNYFGQLAVAALIIILVLPFVTGKGIIICGPIAFLTVAVMLAVV